MRRVAFDYCLIGVENMTDLRVVAEVDLAERTAQVRSTLIMPTEEPFALDDIDLRRCLEDDALLYADEEAWRESL